MAREYGKWYTSAWGDGDFRSLGRAAQHLYMQLVTQPDLSMAGVLTIAPVRWAQQFGGTESEVMDALATLTERRFVHVDQETQELLVRSYIRLDDGWRSPTTMKGIWSAMNAVLSPGLKSVLADEIRRIDTSSLSEKISEKTGRSTKEVVMGYIQAFLDSVIPHRIPLPIPHPEGYPMGINGFSHTTEPEPEPEPTHEPTPTPTPTPNGASSEVLSPDVPREPEHRVEDEPRSGAVDVRSAILAREYYDRVPLCNKSAVSAVVHAAMQANYPEAKIRAGLRILASEGRTVTAETLRIAIEGKPTPAAPPKPKRTIGREGW